MQSNFQLSAHMKLIKGLFKHPLFLLSFLIIPALMNYLYIAKHAVNIPFWDEWSYLRSREHLENFSFSWLFAQHNEHKIVFTKIQTYLIYSWNQWDIASQIKINFFLYFLTICLFVYSLLKISEKGKLFILLSSIFLLGTRSYENHMWGFQSQFHLVILFSSLLILSLFRENDSLFSHVIAAFFAICVIHTFSSGLPMVLAITTIYFLTVAFRVKSALVSRKQLAYACVYLIIVALGFLFYFSDGYSRVEGHPPYTFPYDAAFWKYFVSILTNGFAIRKKELLTQWIVFVLVFIPLVWGVFQIFLKKQHFSFLHARLIAFWAMVLAVLVIITIGRAGFGIEQAYSSRYIEFSALLIPLTVCSWLVFFPGNKNLTYVMPAIIVLGMIYTHRKTWNYDQIYNSVSEQRMEGIKCIEKKYIESKKAVHCPTLYPQNIKKMLDNAKALNVSFISEKEKIDGKAFRN